MAGTAEQLALQATLIADLTARLERDEAEIAANAASAAVDATNMDIGWLITCGALVFFMQAGFGMLEAGAVSKKNVINILFKNLLDGSCAAIGFWLLGYGFAYGDTAGGFIGTTNFGSTLIHNGAGLGENGEISNDGWVSFFFQWAFAGTAATIVSGSVAERTKLEAYIIFSVILTAFIYPVVVHWVWGTGFLSAWGAIPDADGNARPIFSGTDASNGMIDFAGSGVVHMLGGWCGLVGAVVVGPRMGRFDSHTGKPQDMHYYNSTLMALGTFILWTGWYGFNCGSTLSLSGNAGNVAGKVAVSTTIAAAAASLTCVIIARVKDHIFDVGMGLNGILAGLVSITAGCCIADPWMAFIIGVIGGAIYYIAHHLLLRLRIDDPLDAFPIHGVCGCWAVLSVGVFCTDANVQYAGYPNTNDACARGEQFGVQVVGALCIITWSVVTASITMLGMNVWFGMRVPEHVEIEGLDVSEHGGVVDGVPQSRGSSSHLNAVVPLEAGKRNTQMTGLVPGGDEQHSSTNPVVVRVGGAPKPPGAEPKADSLDLENF